MAWSLPPVRAYGSNSGKDQAMDPGSRIRIKDQWIPDQGSGKDQARIPAMDRIPARIRVVAFLKGTYTAQFS
jgi:hypothetical protein